MDGGMVINEMIGIETRAPRYTARSDKGCGKYWTCVSYINDEPKNERVGRHTNFAQRQKKRDPCTQKLLHSPEWPE